MWFKKKNRLDVQVKPNTEDRLEIELAKDASQKAFEKANLINNHVNQLLIENGITVKIYLATGGKGKQT